MERALDVGEGDVHHGDVEKKHEGGRADGDEGPPFALECWHVGLTFGRNEYRSKSDRI
jgi:hypothetical protein